MGADFFRAEPQDMNHIPTLRTAATACLLLAALAAGDASASQRPGTPVDGGHRPQPVRVTVSILPQAWFVRQIGGDQVIVDVLVGPGDSPATYEPTPREMAALQESAVFFSAGVPFERGLLPRMENLQKQPFIVGPRPATGAHGHHDGHDHDHGDIDPHTWLDPLQARDMAREMAAALGHVRPDATEWFQANLQELELHLARIDADVAALLAPCRGATFYVFHPAFGHFAARYGLQQRAIEAGGHEPGSRHMAEIISEARAAGVRTIFVQPQFSQRAAGSVARSVGAEVVLVDPLPAVYDTGIYELAETLRAHLPCAGEQGAPASEVPRD
jgi:zinc transport system substrate-binding protein